MELFAGRYLAEIVNEGDPARRAAAIDRWIDPGICHVTTDIGAVYGHRAFADRVTQMAEVLGQDLRAELTGAPRVEDNTTFFRWTVGKPGEEPTASGSAFVVFTGDRASWFYTTFDVANP